MRCRCSLKPVPVFFAPILSLLFSLTVRRVLGLQLLVLLRLLLQHPRLPVLLVLIGRCGLLPGPAELLKEAEARPRRRSLVLGSRCPRVLRFFRYCGDDTRKPDSVHQSSVRKLGAISFLEILLCVFADRLAIWNGCLSGEIWIFDTARAPHFMSSRAQKCSLQVMRRIRSSSSCFFLRTER